MLRALVCYHAFLQSFASSWNRSSGGSGHPQLAVEGPGASASPAQQKPAGLRNDDLIGLPLAPKPADGLHIQ